MCYYLNVHFQAQRVNVNLNISLEQSNCAFNRINKRLDSIKMDATTVKKKMWSRNF